MNFVLQKVFSFAMRLRKTMFLEMIVESPSFIGEIVIEVLFDFVTDCVPDWLARRRK